MIPDLDAIHTWNGEFSINRLWEPGAAPNYPRVRIDPVNGLPGFHSLPEGEDRRDIPIARPFIEVPRTSYRQGKSLVYSGWLEARDEAGLDQLEDDMTAAFQSMDLGQMIIEQFSTGDKYLYSARCTALAIDGNAPTSTRRATNGHERSFVLSLRMLDGRFYEFDPQVETGLAVSVNVGKVPTDPNITIINPSTIFITLTNTSSNRAIKMNNPDGSTITVDFSTRSILKAGVDVTDIYLVEEDTDWWDKGIPGLQPGVNNLTLAAGGGVQMSVSWRKAHFG